MDSFIELSSKKEFKDITTEAMINRATFYYHFQDKYDLLEKVLSEVLMINPNGEIIQQHELNEETIIRIFLAITNFQNSLSNRCHRGYKDTISAIIKEQLEIIFLKMLLKRNDNEEALKITAVMLSWGLYGASIDWR
jgi:AcrR family transcriptional regulator